MTEITEIDMNKYIVIKIDDVEKYLLPKGLNTAVKQIVGIIGLSRQADGKSFSNEYLVLNLGDEIDLSYLIKQTLRHDKSIKNLKVSDIAVDLVNAILKAKEKNK